MKSDKNPKEKLIDRIMRENIKYVERFNNSIINQYYLQCTITAHNKENFEKEVSIVAPKFTDDSELEQAYQLAHELGHYNLNKRLSPIMFKICQLDNIWINNIVERIAWNEAKAICIEENIPIGQEFNYIKFTCLDTYTKDAIAGIRKMGKFILNIIISYYLIFLIFNSIYQGTTNNIYDLFGVIRVFEGINKEFVYNATSTIWIMYIVIYILIIIFKKILAITYHFK
jgi:hypothetical protein